MGKHWVRQQVKHNELADFLDWGLIWLSKNRQTAGIAGGVILAAGLAAGLTLYRSRAVQRAAWDQLSLAQGLAYTGRADVSLQQIKELESQYPNAKAAGFALLFAGDTLYPRAQYKEALEYYAKILELGQPKNLLPLALGGTAITQEASGAVQQALQTAQRFLETYPDHFLAPQVHACLARCLEAAGQAEQAKAACQKIVLQYPDTYWASWAQNRLQKK